MKKYEEITPIGLEAYGWHKICNFSSSEVWGYGPRRLLYDPETSLVLFTYVNGEAKVEGDNE